MDDEVKMGNSLQSGTKYSAKAFSALSGVPIPTLYSWRKTGRLTPDFTSMGRAYYTLEHLKIIQDSSVTTRFNPEV